MDYPKDNVLVPAGVRQHIPQTHLILLFLIGVSYSTNLLHTVA